MKTIRPSDYQPALDIKKFILENAAPTGEEVPMDVAIVGGGPAGLSTAIHLARLIREDNEKGGSLGDVQIAVLEKAQNLGGHTLSGAVMNPCAIRALLPELQNDEFPHQGKVRGDRVYFLTESGKIRLPTPPTMHNDGNYVVSLCELVRFLGAKAEELGVNVFTSFPADSLLTENGQVTGVRTAPAGLLRDGSPGSQYMAPNDIKAKTVVLAEGTRGPLAQAYCHWKKIASKHPQIFALGVKELWKVKRPPEFVTHTLGFPLPMDAFGGSWLYPMGNDMVSFGLVAGLDYKPHTMDVHKMLQKLKSHPLFKEVLDEGELLEWGAKTIPEGGWDAIPESLSGDGLIMIGDTAGFVNVPALKGIHYAVQSGMLAAEAIFTALKNNDFSAKTLRSYDDAVRSSYIHDDLKKVRNMRLAFKSGFIAGSIQAGLMTLTGGAFPGGPGHIEEDAKEEKFVASNPMENIGLSKVDGVYRAGNKTRDDIPQHLEVGKDIPPEVADMYAAMCPAGVYERQGDKLVINSPNCVDCKATDVLGPRWQPREGGAGPDYKLM